MMSPQGIGGDDRCGVYIILSLLKQLSVRPHILFTMDEEIGGIGAKAFAGYIANNKILNLKYIVEYDRKGNNDAVFYDCDNDDFTNFVEKFGFTRAYGTFSDISVIAPELGVAAVNLSSGYYNPHTEHEYVSMKDMENIIKMSLNMLNAECESFEYIEMKSYRYPIQHREVCISFLPEQTVYVCSKYNHHRYINSEFEIAIDAHGNYYRYDATYDDLITLYADIEPIEDDLIPMYNPEEAYVCSVYF